MERYKENLGLRKEQNIVSFVMMLCISMFLISFYGAFSVSQKQVKNEQSGEQSIGKLVINQNL